jgi:hypothetical protein
MSASPASAKVSVMIDQIAVKTAVTLGRLRVPQSGGLFCLRS